MPILHIRALPQRNPLLIRPAMKATAIAISEVYGCDPKHVWITWEDIAPGFYFEGGREALIQELETHPPICELTCFEGASSETIEKLLLVTAKTLSEKLEISNNIFITYIEAKSGQVVAGDGIVRKQE